MKENKDFFFKTQINEKESKILFEMTEFDIKIKTKYFQNCLKYTVILSNFKY